MQRKVSDVEERLARALLQLLQEKPFADITIKELVLTAQVSRSSFYRHYSGLLDVLDLCGAYVMEEFGRELTRTSGFTNYDVAVAYFTFWQKQQAFFRCLLENDLLQWFLAQYDKYMLAISAEYEHHMDALDPDRYPRMLAYSFYYGINGLWGMAYQWLLQGCPESPEQLAAYIVEFFTGTFYQEPACRQFAETGEFPFPLSEGERDIFRKFVPNGD